MEIPEDIRQKYGFEPLGPANGPVKTAILGGNNARLYGFTPKMQSALENDQVAQWRNLYDKSGGDRSNLVYGYTRKPGA